MVRTPDDLLAEIAQLRNELMRGSAALYEAELKAERAEDAAQLALDAAYLNAEGNIEDRKSVARGASASEQDAAFVARAELNRIKSKIKALESSLMSLQSELKWAREAGA